MRRLWPILLLVVIWAGSSCARWKGGEPRAGSGPILTPDLKLSGTVVSVNSVGRFVVLRFAGGSLPAVGQELSVYRQGLKVGEVMISGPQRDDHIVADIVAGEARVGDEVRLP